MNFFADAITVGEVAASDYPMITTISDEGKTTIGVGLIRQKCPLEN